MQLNKDTYHVNERICTGDPLVWECIRSAHLRNSHLVRLGPVVAEQNDRATSNLQHRGGSAELARTCRQVATHFDYGVNNANRIHKQVP
jgi:hypothetical protein